MGGCRCTYRNCSVRSDGKTHMFHYPVFEKVRCHQWLTNADKLEFLNLKVSQLKNRVVCQHHFRDECFMNFLKDKLTFDAVPTEDGPYCDSSQWEVKRIEQDETKGYSISLDDIENEYLTLIDKKANFSVKYGDFLTNCDLMDLDTLSRMNQNRQITVNSLCGLESCSSIPKDLPFSEPVKSITHIYIENNSNSNNIFNDNTLRKNAINEINNTVHDNNKKCDIQEIDDQNPKNVLLNLSQVPIEYEEIKINEKTNPEKSIEINIDMSSESKLGEIKLNEQYHNNPINIAAISKSQQEQNTNRSLLKGKVRIISEKKISEPVSLIGKLEPVSPTRILTFPNKKRKVNVGPVENTPEVSTNGVKEITIQSDERIIQNNSVIEKPKSVPRKIIYEDSQSKDSLQDVRGNVVNKINDGILPKTSILKNKIPPERAAAIAEKRKFNMKLRDIIENCLDKLDEPEKIVYDDHNLSYKSRDMNIKQQKVSSYLAKDQELPNVKDYTVAYLEARMKKMENTLLNKIDQNTQRIVELQSKLTQSRKKKKTVHTQTLVSEDQHKKQLYQEISKYLTKDANSLVYEELFINKYDLDVPMCPSKKRRKYKR